MSAQIRPRSPVSRRFAILWRYRLPAVLAVCGLLTQACAPIAQQSFDRVDASDPEVRVPPVAYRSVLGGYASQRPVEPLPWTERNQSVAPQPKKDGQ